MFKSLSLTTQLPRLVRKLTALPSLHQRLSATGVFVALCVLIQALPKSFFEEAMVFYFSTSAGNCS